MKNILTAIIGLFVLLVFLENVFAADDHGDTCHSATPISINSSISGTIETASDMDVFSIVVRSQQTLTIFTTGSLDTFGALNTSDCKAIDGLPGNDNGGEDKNFEIVATLSAGTYNAIVLLPPGGSKLTGKYTLHVEDSSGDGGDGNGDACVSSALLSKENRKDLQTLRNFRDGILSKNLTGLGLIRLYYKHSAEVINILSADQELKFRAGEILLALIEIAKNTSSDDSIVSIAQNSIPLWLEVDINTLLDEMVKHGRDELKTAIRKSRAVLHE